MSNFHAPALVMVCFQESQESLVGSIFSACVSEGLFLLSYLVNVTWAVGSSLRAHPLVAVSLPDEGRLIPAPSPGP